jgi:hypothetical protein
MTACWGAGEVGVLMGVKGRCVVRAKRAVSVSGAAGGRAFWVAKGEASSVCGWAACEVALVMATRGLFV